LGAKTWEPHDSQDALQASAKVSMMQVVQPSKALRFPPFLKTPSQVSVVERKLAPADSCYSPSGISWHRHVFDFRHTEGEQPGRLNHLLNPESKKRGK
jgi:hypothetical protein